MKSRYISLYQAGNVMKAQVWIVKMQQCTCHFENGFTFTSPCLWFPFCLHSNYNLPLLYLMLVLCGTACGELKRLQMRFSVRPHCLPSLKSELFFLHHPQHLHKQPVHFLSWGGWAKATSLLPVYLVWREMCPRQRKNQGTGSVSLSSGCLVDWLTIVTRTKSYFFRHLAGCPWMYYTYSISSRKYI